MKKTATDLPCTFSAQLRIPESTRYLSGSVEIFGEYLAFKNTESQWNLPISALELSRSTGNNKQWLCVWPEKNWTLTTSETEFAKSVLAKSAVPMKDSWNKSLQTARRTSLIVLSVLLIIVALIASLWWIKDPILQATAKMIPKEIEAKLGSTYIESQTNWIEDSIAISQLNDLAAPILKTLPQNPNSRGYTYTLRISQDTTINAFALPGGFIVVHKGLIQKVSNAAELQGVLAHEIAHCEMQHGLRNILSTIGLQTSIALLVGDFGGLSAWFATQAGQLATLKFSREFEREADEFGSELLLKAKINPQGMVDFFVGLGQHEGTSWQILSTHPASEERANHIQNKISQLPKQIWVDDTKKLQDLQKRL